MEKIEENLKNLVIERKELISILNQLKPLVEIFNQSGNSNTPPDSIAQQQTLQQQNSGGNNNSANNASIFNKDGSLTKQAFDAIVKYCNSFQHGKTKSCMKLINTKNLNSNGKRHLGQKSRNLYPSIKLWNLPE